MHEVDISSEFKEIPQQLSVAQFVYYPVKSLGGSTLQRAEIGPKGILHDREFMVYDPNAEDGLFRSQRKNPRMALIRPELTSEVLYLRAEGMENMAVQIIREGKSRVNRVHKSITAGIDQGDEAAEWLSEFIKAPSRLVRQPDDHFRPVSPRFAQNPDIDQVSYADGYPFLLISTASLEDLNRRLVETGNPPQPVPMNRFRPNIVMKSKMPYIEDTLDIIEINGVRFKVAKPCGRCPIPTTDQDTAARNKEPMRTLLSYRPINEDKDPEFGQNLIHLDKRGVLEVGAPVTIISHKKVA